MIRDRVRKNLKELQDGDQDVYIKIKILKEFRERTIICEENGEEYRVMDVIITDGESQGFLSLRDDEIENIPFNTWLDIGVLF